MASRHLEEAEAAAEEIRQGGGKAISLCADISRVETLAPMVEETVACLGKIDILINNAGANVRKPAIDFTEAEWDRVLDTNLKGTFFCAQAVARQMIRQGGVGKIINTSSAAGGRPVAWLTPYSVSKAAINHMTRALAVEWGRYGITVNGIAPSYMETPLTRSGRAIPNGMTKSPNITPSGESERFRIWPAPCSLCIKRFGFYHGPDLVRGWWGRGRLGR